MASVLVLHWILYYDSLPYTLPNSFTAIALLPELFFDECEIDILLPSFLSSPDILDKSLWQPGGGEDGVFWSLSGSCLTLSSRKFDSLVPAISAYCFTWREIGVVNVGDWMSGCITYSVKSWDLANFPIQLLIWSSLPSRYIALVLRVPSQVLECFHLRTFWVRLQSSLLLGHLVHGVG